jgi:hypothetical protein
MLPDNVLQELETYAVRYLNAEQTIGIHKTQQASAAKEIVARLPIGDKTQRTETLPSSGRKIVVKGGNKMTVDIGGIKALFSQPDLVALKLPAPIVTKTTITETLDATGYEWYKVNHPEIFARIAQFVMITPKNASVTVKEPKGS